MEKKELIYEGKAKKVFKTAYDDYYIQYFKDDATAFNAKKKGTIGEKGVVNNKVSCVLFKLLEQSGVSTHFEKILSDREMLVKKLSIIMIEVTIRNIVAGGMAKRLGIEEGMKLKNPVFEYHYKSDALDDPLINEDHIYALGLATPEELRKIHEYSIKINEILKNFWSERNVDLVDFKLEFGRHKGEIYLGDEISPDTCRFWEKGTGRKIDKDRFRRDLGNIEEAYQEILRLVEN